MIEEWKTSLTLPEYQVSSFGRVRRIPHYGTMPNGGVRVYGGQPWCGNWDGERFIITYKGKTYKVARLICEAFNGPEPFIGAVVMHDDEMVWNNQAGNLKWGTQKENLNYPRFLEYAALVFPAKLAGCKIPF